MTGGLSKNFHGVGIGPLSKILAVKLSEKSCKQGKKRETYDLFVFQNNNIKISYSSLVIIEKTNVFIQSVYSSKCVSNFL